MAAEPAGENGTPATRTPRSVINEAIRETAAFNGLCYWGLIVFGMVGVVAILAGVVRGDAWIGSVGAIPLALCWPAMRYANLIRKQNITLRMLELSLNNVKTADEALKAINQAFGIHFGDPEIKENVAIPKPKKAASGGGS